MTSNEIRRTFLNYFAARGHRIVRSSSLVPASDPTLLFANAGMNQFKDVFLGLEQRDYQRATSSQKCVRAGGKHNDLENVGRTKRHHTFFEMLGNFSFGDYFKKDAIEYAWELVTREYKLPIDRLYVTVFGGGEISGQFVEGDEVARGYWKTTGVAPDRIFEGGIKDNFWAMGETGPCGPCSEIHYDLGPEASDLGHAGCTFPCPEDCGRYMEIWNLVFMQFNRDAGGGMTPLPRPSIDTGMGLERVAAVLQGKISNFETDLLFPLIEEAAEMAGTDYGAKPESDVSLRILADHSRAAAFLIHDGVLPANDGRGYVLRKIMRRAIRHGRMLGMDKPFLYQLTGKVAELMAEPYPELLESVERVAAVVKSEEIRFATTMTVAIQEFSRVVTEAEQILRPQGPVSESDDDLGNTMIRSGKIILPGDKLFRLYDTFGMPLDWIKEMADERGMGIDEAGFDAEMQRQRERARASWKGAEKAAVEDIYRKTLEKRRTEFLGYNQTSVNDCRVIAVLETARPKYFKDEKAALEHVKENHPESKVVLDRTPLREQIGYSLASTDLEVVLDRTPFYAAAGGQVGDTGWLRADDEVIAIVEDTYAPLRGLIVHRVRFSTGIDPNSVVGLSITAVVDSERRAAIKRNHTATHLLHAALRQVLGTHVKQAGSVVEPGRLRFDFSHFAPVGESEVEEIERLANAEILKNIAVETNVMELDQALETGAMAFFGEKYPERVRVVSVPGFSQELCGGTHVTRTGDIGILKITSEGGISAGVRRVEAVTGTKALNDFDEVTNLVRHLSVTLKTSPQELAVAVEKLAESERNLAKQVETLRMKAATSELANVEERARAVKDVKVLTVRVDALDRGQMRTMADVLRQKLKSGVVVLGSAADGKVALIAALTSDLTKRLHAGKIAQAVAQRLGGTGGGRPDMAEAGGKNATLLDTVLSEVYDIVDRML